MTALVTKQSLADMLEAADDRKKAQIIGRALVALFERQTEAEKSTDHTKENNGVGFAGCDARGGSLTAKSFLKNRTLADWQVERWTRVSRGFPRICKYAGQLNEIALSKLRKELNPKLEALRIEYAMVVDSDDPKVIEPIVTELRALEAQLGVAPYVIGGAVA